MDQDKILRTHLLSLLQGGNAHIKFNDAIKNFPMRHINTVLPDVPYTCWQLLEHMRITQFDILDFIENPKYKYINWPQDYWPSKSKKATTGDWKGTIASFKGDSKALELIVNSPKADLYAKIPHGTGQTILREILLVADHNAYHLGELVFAQRALGIWKD